jgi:hypothetical protein
VVYPLRTPLNARAHTSRPAHGEVFSRPFEEAWRLMTEASSLSKAARHSVFSFSYMVPYWGPEERRPGAPVKRGQRKLTSDFHYPPLLGRPAACATPLTLLRPVLWTVPESREKPTLRSDSARPPAPASLTNDLSALADCFWKQLRSSAHAVVPANGPAANGSQPHPLLTLRLLGVAQGLQDQELLLSAAC